MEQQKSSEAKKNNPWPMIIAMKGHPGTGKSTLAKSIATTLHCPLLDKDDIRDATLSLSSTSPPSSLNNLSYDALWRVTSTQLQIGLSVVIDSTLSRRTHLDKLLDLTAGTQHRIVIVECKPSDEAEWRRRLERRGEGAEEGCHKPATWEDIERLMEVYDGCSEYDVGDVPRIVVDTTGPDDVDVVLLSVINFIEAHCGPLST